MATQEWIDQSARLQYETLEDWLKRIKRLHKKLYGIALSRACENKIRDKFAQWYYCGKLDVGVPLTRSRKMDRRRNLPRYVTRQVAGGNAKDTWTVFDTLKKEVTLGPIRTRKEARDLARDLNSALKLVEAPTAA